MPLSEPPRLPIVEPTPEDFAFSRLLAYAAYQWPGYADAAHHRLIARKLEAVERGDIRRLMISMPPRHGKSMLASEFFPAWYIGRNPNHYVIAATYAQELADDFGRKVRNQIADPAYKAIFPGVALKDDSTSAKRFHISAPDDAFATGQDGAYFAVGVGGPLTGRGAHLLLIDDPVKNREEADSETIRKKTREWYTSTAYTRLMKDGRVVVIQTRWHENDLSGWLLEEHQHEGWDVLSLPAINDEGKALWPDMYPVERLNQIKLAVGPRDWSALYQQRPAPEEGDYFKAEWLKTVSQLPPRGSLRVYGGSDYAVTAAGGDYTVHAVVGLDPEGRMYLLDLWRGQTSSDQWIEAFCDLVAKWRPIGWAEEGGQIKAGVGPFLQRRMMERQAFVAREAFPTRGDKAVRAQSIRGRMAMNGLYMLADAPWRADLQSEMMSFPVGVHDDQCLADGTLISMADGTQKPIELVEVGEMVATPDGPRQVDAAAITNEAAQVFRIRTNCGRELLATANHPLFVEGRGFIRVDALGMMDQLRLEPSCSEDRQRPTSLNIGATAIAGIQAAVTHTIATIFTRLNRAADFFTGTFGKTISGQSLKGTTFTIGTKTRSTTTRSILSASRNWNTGDAIRSTQTSANKTGIIWTAFATRLLNGTRALRGAHGIGSMVGEPGLAGSAGFIPRVARPAQTSLMPHSSAHGSAHARVSSGVKAAADQNAGDILRTVRQSPVSVAIGNSLRTGLKPQLTAQRRAGCVIGIEALSEKVRVRNLTVNRAHVFYANGILTHNCDALGLVGQLLDRMQNGKPLNLAPNKPPQPPGTIYLPGAPEPEDRTRRNWG